MKRIFLLLSLLIFILSVSISYAQDETILRWRTRPDNQASIDVYQAVSDKIDEEWDGVILSYEPGGSETARYQNDLITEIEAGIAPDVFWIPGSDVARFASAGMILNLTEYAAADESFDANDFYAGPMSFLTTQLPGAEGDVLWGLPRDVSSFAVYYNQELFDQAGLDYPQNGWTWDEFEASAAAISALGEETYGFGMNAWWANYGYFVNAAGGSLFTEDYTACGLNSDATVEGLTFATELFANGYGVPWGMDTEPPFLAGNVGMFMNGRWATPGILTRADFNWNVVALPIGPSGEETNWLFWGAYVVNTNTEYPEESWELIRRLTSASVQGEVANLGANIPSRLTEEATNLFLSTLPDTGVNNQIFLDGTMAADVRTEVPLFYGNWSAIDTAYRDGVSKVFNGDLKAEDFASTICDEVATDFIRINFD